MSRSTRRTFLGQSLAAGAAVGLAPRSLLGASASEQVNLGVIGCGWRGGQLLEAFSQVAGVKIAGVCDADRQRVDETAQKYPGASTWTDLRQMLDSPDIDAVVIATCNHWHCLAALWAMEAGKHVYVEKPLGHFHWEGAQTVKAAAAYRKVCQVGTQQRSDPMQAEIKALLHDDRALGAIQWVRVNRVGVREPIGLSADPLRVPETVDIDLWTGPAQIQTLYRNALHYDWHWDWNTGSGEMGNWGVHVLDDVRNNVFRDQVQVPSKIFAASGRIAWRDAGSTPNFHFALMQCGRLPVAICLSNLPKSPGAEESPRVKGPSSGYIAYCEGGRLEGQRGSAAAFDSSGKMIKQFAGRLDQGQAHQANFIAAVRDGDPSLLNAPVEVGHYSTAWCNLANIAARVAGNAKIADVHDASAQFAGADAAAELLDEMHRLLQPYGADAQKEFRVGAVLDFDSQTERFTGDQAAGANELLRRKDRAPFLVPEVS